VTTTMTKSWLFDVDLIFLRIHFAVRNPKVQMLSSTATMMTMDETLLMNQQHSHSTECKA
jgi:hypothetical protein